MRRFADLVPALVSFGLVAGCLTGCSKRQESAPPARTQGGQVETKDLRANAEKGDARAQAELGWNYRQGLEVTADDREAVKWLQKAAGQGWTNALYLLGEIYGDANSPLHDPKQSFQLTKRAAAAGDISAQVTLGFKYLEGLGVATNSDEGLRWIRTGISAMEDAVAKAMARTNARFEAVARQVEINLCACRLGEHYAEGRVLPRDLTQAVYWFEKAKDAPRAQQQLGWLHLTQTKNYSEAAKWLGRAAEAGNARAQENLAGLYYQGLGVAQDYGEAFKWFRLAAQAGEAPAERMLGVFYQDGYSVAPDSAEAAKWYRSAAEQGDVLAQQRLGYHYLSGLGVSKDYVEGYKWASLAAAQGDEISRKNCDAARRLMTADQIAEAQRRSSAFVARKENEKSRDVFADLIPKYAGTGFFITDNGYLLTSAHVIERATRVEIFADGKAFPAKLVKADVTNDVALLKVNCTSTAVALVTSQGVKLGDFIFTIGFPRTIVQGTEPKLTQGEISSLAGASDDPRHFQISVPVQPGNSGGPLVDRSGSVIGLIKARFGGVATRKIADSLPQNVNYALKSSLITAFLQTVPEVPALLKPSRPANERPLAEIAEEIKQSTALVAVYCASGSF